MYDAPDFKNMLHELQTECGWTQMRLSEELSCSQAQVNRLRHGVNKNPHAALGFRIHELHKREMANLKRRQAREQAA